MGECEVRKKELKMDHEAAKLAHPHAHTQSAPQATIRSVAERADVAFAVPPLPKPQLPALPTPAMAAHTASSAMQDGETKTWNTQKLGLRMGADAVAAGAAGVLVAPVITMIDKGIIENASGRCALGESLKNSVKEFVARPHRFLASKPFALIFVRRANPSPLPPVKYPSCEY